MEQRLIDANRLKNCVNIALKLNEKLAELEPDVGELVSTICNGFIKQIDAMPTIEAVSASELKAMEKERDYYRNLAESYERTILALTDAIGRKDGNETD